MIKWAPIYYISSKDGFSASNTVVQLLQEVLNQQRTTLRTRRLTLQIFLAVSLVMAILHHLALVLVLSCIIKLCVAKPDKKLVKRLFDAMEQLEYEKIQVAKLMYIERKSAGYGPFKNKPCRLATSPIYKFVSLKENTLAGHLIRIQMILDPFISASKDNNWTKNVGSTKLQEALKDVAFQFRKARFRLYQLDPSINFPPAVTYNSTVLSYYVRLYLVCAGIPRTPTAMKFLRAATFVKGLRYAMENMTSDIRYLKNYQKT